MARKTAIVIGAGVGGLSAALELNRRGFQVTVLERHAEVGGKASARLADGFRWDEGPSIIVMPWVYRTLFEASGLDPDEYLPLRRLDPAFRIVLADGRDLVIPASVAGLRDTFAAIDPRDGPGLDRFLAKVDRFAGLMGHAYCDRLLESWGQVMMSPLMVSAALISPYKTYAEEIAHHFQSAAIRELLHGFPTYSGFSPETAPASLVVIPWTIIREGVWYPVGGVAAIPRSIARACRDRGVEIRTGVEVEAIELDATGTARGVATSSGALAADVVVSNSDYVHTYRMLRSARSFPADVEALRHGEAEPSFTYFTVQLGCDRTWDLCDHHLMVMTAGATRSIAEIFERREYPSDPPIYVNTTSKTDPVDAVPGGSNPFLVIGAPATAPGAARDDTFAERYAAALIARLEGIGLSGLSGSIRSLKITTPHDWEQKFHAFRGSIYGLGTTHNVLGGAFRPLNYCPQVPNLYFAGGGVQPGAGLPMVVQSGKITAERIARDQRSRSRSR